jgi:two-component system, OmpR family, response regulator
MNTPRAPYTPHVLVVDDEAQIRQMFGRFLERSGVAVTFAADGVRGLAQARRQLPDAIVSDLDMPVMDGLALCQALRRDPITRAVPILIVSGNGPESLRAALDAGCDAVLAKPCSGRRLVACIDELLGRKPRLPGPGVSLPHTMIDR